MGDGFYVKLCGRFSSEVIFWPVVRSTDKARLVEMPGGQQCWLPLWRFSTYFNSTGDERLIHSLRADRGGSNGDFSAEIEAFITRLSGVISTGQEAHVRVWKAGKGASEKSHKFRFQYQVEVHPEPQPKVFERTVSLPVSQIRQVDDNWMAPAWVIKRRLKTGESLVNPEWLGAAAVRRHLEEVAARVKSSDAELKKQREEEAQKKLAAQNEQNAHHAQQIQVLQSRIAANGEAALAFCRRKFQLSDMPDSVTYWPTWPVNTNEEGALRKFVSLIEFAEGQPAFPAWKAKNAGKQLIKPPKVKVRIPDKVLENVRVCWSEWQFSSTRKEKTDYEAEGCTVRVYGAKMEITMPSGETFTKMAGPNLRICETGV